MNTVIKIKTFSPFILEFTNADEPFRSVSVLYPDTELRIPIVKSIPDLGSISGTISSGGFDMEFNVPMTAGQITDLLVLQKSELENLASLHTEFYQSQVGSVL